MQVKCSDCQINLAIQHPTLGIIACFLCRKKDTSLTERTYEVVPQHIKDERQEFRDQTIQPFRNGELSKEYIDLYGSNYIQATPEEIKNAKNVWSRDLPGEYYKR